MAWTREKIDEVYLKAQQMAATDEEFREELLKTPNTAIAKIAGEAVPEDFKVKILENDPNYTATFVLPPMVSEELDEGALEEVAGGACVNDGCIGDACAAKATINK